VPNNKYGYDFYFTKGRYMINPYASQYGRFLGYIVYFLNEKGSLAGGLWQELGKVRSPQAGRSLAKKHFEQNFTTVKPFDNYAFDVILNGKSIDTIFMSSSMFRGNTKAEMEDDVRQLLVNHDGYNPGIKVIRRPKLNSNPKKRTKKRPVNLNAIAGAIKSPKTPKHLKEGLIRKYGHLLGKAK